MADVRHVDTALQFDFHPIAIQRSKWTHQFHVWSPKLSRRLSLYSHAAVDFWAMMESYASVLTFCEYPGLILVDQKPRIADFVLRRDDVTEFVVVEATLLTAIDAELLEILDPLPVTTVNADALNRHRQWIDNWMRMLPYVTSNHAFLSNEFLDRIEQGLAAPKPLYAIEYEALPNDPVLTRTAVFDLTRRGRLVSPDLRAGELNRHTRFRRVAGTEGAS
ncbi:hypothetical protein DN523_19300 [Burkholderia multivorans]|uniref:hypothetical protein n=1 Tax=Burkholderia multivorans TaxID=87883 RepID=UPI0002780814|nr:hypothetical protein [Burkholderia multivorans]EJO54192.1 hypothetical protein BURMUCF2_B0453 [Burkholderia multivorans CF2]MBJ9657239.1 hypothetical protein [Burkholderia multivorans]MBR8046469.1 hypothetical protein [Burkholderia multivorans]MBR8122551.1 hypothetical protein [Burkholderia multivorans]MBR8338505.1 hypothetical protein [Burkholderia multivorans]